ncbi:MAG TPA: hypothetical protein VF306_19010, partial [Pirellulales bacterium]
TIYARQVMPSKLADGNATMEEKRTRSFTHSGTDIVDVDGVKLHARWRVAGTQDYVASQGAAVDGARNDIALTLYFDKLADESMAVQELLNRIAADLEWPITVDLGRTKYRVLYCQEIRRDQNGDPIGIALTDQPVRRGS